MRLFKLFSVFLFLLVDVVISRVIIRASILLDETPIEIRVPAAE